jgi:hypothetical protein
MPVQSRRKVRLVFTLTFDVDVPTDLSLDQLDPNTDDDAAVVPTPWLDEVCRVYGPDFAAKLQAAPVLMQIEEVERD